MDDLSSFRLVFGDAPYVRVLDFLLETHGLFDYTLTNIAKNAGVSWATINTLFPRLVKLGLVKETRRISRARLYMLNEQSPLAQELLRVYKAVSAQLIEAELARQAARKRKAIAIQPRKR